MGELMTVRDLAARLKISSRQIWKLSASGRLPKPVRLARSVRWRASDIQEFIDAGCVMNRFESERLEAAT